MGKLQLSQCTLEHTARHGQGTLSSFTAVQAEHWRAFPTSGVWLELAGLEGALNCFLRFVTRTAGNTFSENAE